MWKAIYSTFQKTYVNSQLVEDTFKDRFQNTFKDLHNNKSNEDKSYKITLQNEKVLACLKTTNAMLHKT
jgi:hypothetical protein